MSNTICFIQARMSSKRFPGKVLKKIYKNFSILEYLILRAKKIKYIDDVVVITSVQKIDDKILNLCKRKKINIFRGSLKNVFSRLVKASKKFNASTIIHLTADNPFLDYEMAEIMIDYFRKNKLKYLINNEFNSKKRTIPYGMEIQIINQKELVKIYKKISKKKYNFNSDFFEHISLYFSKNKKKNTYQSFKVPRKLHVSKKIRLTIDYKADLEVLKNFATKLKTINYNSIYFRKIIRLYRNSLLN